MPDGGRLVIETFNTHLDFEDVAAVPGLAAGDYVVLSVSDTGAGMTPEVKARAFVFLHDEGHRRGNGLGLATIYGFVRQSGGNATIYSEVGKGTTVNLYLPRTAIERVAEPAEKRRRRRKRARARPCSSWRTTTVRRLTAARLEILGYRVLEARERRCRPEAAQRHGRHRPRSPISRCRAAMSGLDLARRVREARPDARIILTSGYSAELMKREEAQASICASLASPHRRGTGTRIPRGARRRRDHDDGRTLPANE